MSWARQKAFAAVVLLAVIFLQVSAWDEHDLVQLRAEADLIRKDGVRYLVERSGHRDAFVSDFHCRAPLKGERLVMQLAAQRDPGKGFRCTYVHLPMYDNAIATVTWSRSPDEVRYAPLRSLQ